jgi:hypothetical protein
MMKLSSGLSSLLALLHASPYCSVVFTSCPLQIIEAVMAATVPDTTQARMRATLRFKAFGKMTLEEARNITTATSINWSPLTSMESQILQGTELPRHFLSLAHKVHILGHACCEHFIEASLAMHPSYMVKIGERRMGGTYREQIEAAESREYQPGETGPPSWVEEQRVVKALWLIQKFPRA